MSRWDSKVVPAAPGTKCFRCGQQDDYFLSTRTFPLALPGDMLYGLVLHEHGDKWGCIHALMRRIEELEGVADELYASREQLLRDLR